MGRSIPICWRCCQRRYRKIAWSWINFCGAGVLVAGGTFSFLFLPCLSSFFLSSLFLAAASLDSSSRSNSSSREEALRVASAAWRSLAQTSSARRQRGTAWHTLGGLQVLLAEGRHHAWDFAVVLWVDVRPDRPVAPHTVVPLFEWCWWFLFCTLSPGVGIGVKALSHGRINWFQLGISRRSPLVCLFANFQRCCWLLCTESAWR